MKSSPLLGFITGLTAGSILGVLFAPEKGTKTRRKLKDNFSDLTDDLSRKIKRIEKIDHNLTKKGKSTISHINKNIIEL